MLKWKATGRRRRHSWSISLLQLASLEMKRAVPSHNLIKDGENTIKKDLRFSQQWL
jgi:hypothetical protein